MRFLDLYCGAGGSAYGLHQVYPDAEITGVDIKPQPRFPFSFVQADALEYLAAHGREYDFIWASPPCQGYSIMRNLPWLRERTYPLLIAATRAALRATGRPYVIENVMGAQRQAQMGANWLCGTMFGLPFYRHRVFEASFMWLMLPHPPHVRRIAAGRLLGGRARQVVFSTNGLTGVAAVRVAMGIDWMTGKELSQAIPPAYSRYLARWIPPSSHCPDVPF